MGAPLHKLVIGLQGAGTRTGVQTAQPGDQFLDQAELPPELKAAVPEGAKILKPPDVVVHKGTRSGNTVHCPASLGDAVRLFGGDVKTWTQSRGGWTMISVAPQTINVPEGMSAGYLVYVTKPEFYSVPGPVTIENLNFLAISCE